jgi:hypothetical protein
MRDFKVVRERFDQVVDEDRNALALGLDVTLYFQGGFRENAEGVLHFYRKAVEPIRKSVTFYALDGSNAFKKIKPDVFEMPAFWASAEARPRGTYGLDLESGPTRDDASDKALSLYDGGMFQTGHVRVVLPLEHIQESVEPFLALARELAGALRFLHGHGGYAVNMVPSYNSQLPDLPVYALSRRFKGVDLGTPNFFEDAAPSGIKSINWLTFLGTSAVEKLGGRKALEKALGNDIPVHPLPHGVMLQAGPEPSFGDVNRKEALPHYHQVGRVLKPLRIPSDVLGNWDGIGGTENTREWLARFDD